MARTKQRKDFSTDVMLIGVGGGGCTIINNISHAGMSESAFVACDMDKQLLNSLNGVKTVQIGEDGLGAGSDPERARVTAKEDEMKICAMLDSTHTVNIIVTCLGGGCGCGVAPIIARESQRRGKFTIGVVTTPFEFEGRLKFKRTSTAVRELIENTDGLILIKNQSLYKYCDDLSLIDYFKNIDKIISDVMLYVSSNIGTNKASHPINRHNSIYHKVWRVIKNFVN